MVIDLHNTKRMILTMMMMMIMMMIIIIMMKIKIAINGTILKLGGPSFAWCKV